MMITHWEKIYLYFCLTVIFIGCLILGYWFLWPVKVMEIRNPNAVKVDKEVYQAGDRITYSFYSCKFLAVSGVGYRTLVDGTIISFASIESSGSPICGEYSRGDLVIPDYVSTGTYHLENSIYYKINPVKTVMVHWRSVDFKVENNVSNKIEEHDAEDQEKFKSLQNQINKID